MSRRAIRLDYDPPRMSQWEPERFPCYLKTDESPCREMRLIGISSIHPDNWVGFFADSDEPYWIIRHSGHVMRQEGREVHVRLPPQGDVRYEAPQKTPPQDPPSPESSPDPTVSQDPQ